MPSKPVPASQHLVRSNANQQPYGPHPLGHVPTVETPAVILPRLIFRGVVTRFERSDKTSSRHLPGIGLVPPALYQKKNLDEVKAALRTFQSRSDIDTKIKAIHHSLDPQRLDKGDQFYTSWSRSWTIAVHWALAESHSASSTNLSALLKETYVVCALPHHLPNQVYDLPGLVRSSAWARQYQGTGKISPELRALAREHINFDAQRFESVQEVVVFGVVPDSAFFSISLWDLLQAGPTSHRVGYGALGLPGPVLPAFGKVLTLDKTAAFRQLLHKEMSKISEDRLKQAASEVMKLSFNGRFKIDRAWMADKQRADNAKEDHEIQELLAHTLITFRNNERSDWSNFAIAGEICW